MIVPEMQKDTALLFAKRIQEEIDRQHVIKKKITISGGIATFPDDGQNPSKLIGVADEHLYKAKKDGRNRVCGYD